MRLSVTDLLNYYRCPRLLYLNHHGDKSLQRPPTDFLKRLWKVGRTYESKVTDFFKYERPKYKVGDYEKGFQETLELMKKGVETIYQGVLKNDELIGIPDFLFKAQGKSEFGDYYYHAVDIKGASTSREKYLFQLASYSYLLGEIQGFTPLYGGLLLLDLDYQIRHFYTIMSQVVNAIRTSQMIIKNPDSPPDLFIDSSCQMCQWYNICSPEANEKKHLSLVSGISRKIKASLENISIKDYHQLAECSPEDLSEIEELSEDKSQNIILQAKSLKEKKIYIKSLPKLSRQDEEIFIDFESDMIFDEKGTELIRVDYLIGLLSVNSNKENYTNLLLEDEEQLFNDFSKFLNEHIDCNFYHYGHYEQTIFEKKWENLPRVNLINLEKTIKESVIMPVTGYSLKNIANLLGFRWQNKQANAMQSMCWYSQYLETKERAFLDLSIQYNKDDCFALLYLKNWLLSLSLKNLPVKQFIGIN